MRKHLQNSMRNTSRYGKELAKGAISLGIAPFSRLILRILRKVSK